MNSTVTAALMEVGQQGGIMDALDNLAAGPQALITDSTVNGNPTSSNSYGTNPDNPTMTAGSTFAGQFTDHDITFDQTSQLGVSQNPLTSPNARTPALDLDSVFGGGPGIRPDLYVPNPDGSVGPQLQIGSGGVHEDVPRTSNGDGTYNAVLGDPRNDENLMTAGLHCAHILFYNRVLSDLGNIDLSPYPADPFFGLVFDATEPNFSGPINYDRDDLLGGYPAARRYIGWQTFFDFGDGQVKNNKKIDTKISSVLFTLPVPAIAPHTQTSPTVLPQRNLLRQLTWGLPSGQQVAKAMGVPPLKPGDLGGIADVYLPFGSCTPLWYYILAEAKAATGGVTLGPVAGRIVTETLIGLLRADASSYLSNKPGWTPFLGSDLQLGSNLNSSITGNRSYTRAHFLYYAQVVTPGTYR